MKKMIASICSFVLAFLSCQTVFAQNLLSAPTNIRQGMFMPADVEYQRKVIITWDVVPQAVSYRIYTVGSTENLVGTSQTATYTMVVSTSSTFYIKIAGVDAVGQEGQRSETFTIDYARNQPSVPTSTLPPTPFPTDLGMCSSLQQVSYIDPVESDRGLLRNAGRHVSPAQPEYRFTIVGDLLTPFSVRFLKELLPSLQERYGETTEFAYKHYTMDYFEGDFDASLRGECLARQNLLWSHFADLPNVVSSDELVRSGVPLLDRVQYDSCVTDPTVRDMVTAEVKYFREMGVNGSPTFFLQNLANEQKTAYQVVGLNPAMIECAFAQVHSEETRKTDRGLEQQTDKSRDGDTRGKKSRSRIEILSALVSARIQKIFSWFR